MKSIRILSIVAVMLLVIAGFCSCGTKYVLERRVDAAFACNAIPGGYTTDCHSTQSTTVDTDQYGRTIIDLKITGRCGIRALCVYQMIEGEYLYYYDNVCYRCFDYQSENYDQALLEQIKSENDWEKPLDLSKCVKKQLNDEKNLFPAVSYPSYTSREKIEQSVINEYSKIDGFFDVYVTPCDKSATGQELYLIEIWEDLMDVELDSPLKLNSLRFMVVHKDGSYDPENYMIKFDDLQKSNEPLAEIKERNGWIPTT